MDTAGFSRQSGRNGPWLIDCLVRLGLRMILKAGSGFANTCSGELKRLLRTNRLIQSGIIFGKAGVLDQNLFRMPCWRKWMLLFEGITVLLIMGRGGVPSGIVSSALDGMKAAEQFIVTG